ncbi:MAG: DUF3592 domain-containing protein [Terracidiphilus sp.]|jgi:hypothetical protein
MDRVDNATLGFVILCLSIGGVLVVPIVRRARREVAAKNWPSTEAIIQSGRIEELSYGRGSEELPVFEFSYVVDGTYQSGRFSLWAKGDSADALVKEIVEKKMTVKYDPERPSSYYLPDEYIEGCPVSLVPDRVLRSRF